MLTERRLEIAAVGYPLDEHADACAARENPGCRGQVFEEGVECFLGVVGRTRESAQEVSNIIVALCSRRQALIIRVNLRIS